MPEPRSRSSRWRPAAFFAHKVESARAFQSLNERGGLAVEFYALKERQPDFDLEGGQTLSLSLWLTRSASGFVTIPAVEADVFTIRFITAGHMIRRYRRWEETVGAGFATLSAFEDLRSAEASAQFSALSVTLTRSTLLARYRLLEAAPDAPLPHFEPIAPLDSAPMRALFLSVSRMQQRLKLIDLGEDLLFPLLEEIVAYQVLTAWPRRAAPSGALPPDAPTDRIRRAAEFIEAHLGTPIRLADVAAAAGVSVRVLQLSFKRELGVTPFTYILERRLERVRDELLQTSNRSLTINQLARRWGFVHMSDFTLRYRKAFGCTPGETRRSAR